MTRYAVLFLLFCPLSSAQTIQDLLPKGMELDESGKLQWATFKAAPCTDCKGAKKIPCAACDNQTTDRECVHCQDKKIWCPPCQGTGATIDSRVSMTCPQCRGWRKESCHGCHGKKRLINEKGEEHECAGCSGKGAFDCPLCAGTGGADMMQFKGKDLRAATVKDLDALEALRGRMMLAEHEVEWPQDFPKTAEESLEAHEKIVAKVNAFVGLRPDQIDRIRPLLESESKKDSLGVPGVWTLSQHRRALSAHLHAQREYLEQVIWRLKRNSGKAVQAKPIKASSLEWKHWFGMDPDRPSDSICLLGRGFMLTPSAKNTEAVIQQWMKKHPEAQLVRVTCLDTMMRDNRDARLIYAWVVDAEENLNLHLVRQGCIPAGTMVAPSPLVDIDLAVYHAFIKDAVAGEKEARAKKLGYWGSKPALEESHLDKGKRAMKAGRYQEALEQLLVAVENGADPNYTWLDIGECLEKLERWEEALDAYDKSIGEGGWWPPYRHRAHCLRRYRGLDAAVKWLQDLGKDRPDEHKWPYLMGSFLEECEEFAKAIPHYERAVEVAARNQDFRFKDDGWLVLDEATLAKENNDYATLWPTLERLADCCYRTKAYSKALKFATMGVAIGQQLNRCKGYYGKAEIEAGDVGCRLFRARVLLGRGKWEEGEREVRFAKVLAERGSYTGWKVQIRELEEWIKKTRPPR